jgi:hypothetical protein
MEAGRVVGGEAERVVGREAGRVMRRGKGRGTISESTKVED